MSEKIKGWTILDRAATARTRMTDPYGFSRGILISVRWEGDEQAYQEYERTMRPTTPPSTTPGQPPRSSTITSPGGWKDGNCPGGQGEPSRGRHLERSPPQDNRITDERARRVNPYWSRNPDDPLGITKSEFCPPWVKFHDIPNQTETPPRGKREGKMLFKNGMLHHACDHNSERVCGRCAQCRNWEKWRRGEAPRNGSSTYTPKPGP